MRGAILAMVLAQQIQLPREIPKLTGKFLVATPKSQDRDFARSVILVIHSDVDGVMGLIINRRGSSRTWFGGPIPLGVRELFPSPVQPGDAERVVSGVYLTRKVDDRQGSRVYAGYAGWSVPQWDGEVSRGLWRIVAADPKLVFDPHPETLWQRLSSRPPAGRFSK